MTFDGEPPLTLARDEAPDASPRLGRKALIGGVVVACVVGLGLGFAAKPQLIATAPKPLAMLPASKTGERQMAIEMAQPPPEAPAAKTSPLEVMSPELARAAAANTPPPSPRFMDVGAPDPEAIEPWPAGREQASFDCARAASHAEEMVCSDPALAAADRHLARAFQRAVRLGVPYDLLEAEQNSWMVVREEAARRSPRAVAAIYDQRIEQLNAMARGEGPDW